ncbi:ArsI/CadI family heavy metal resistance metalloenzyme [Noviherbaspirillum sp. CPCC 100848]|uniref:ArsI/CadI family heavy metal resistance metalloenzyme n=1 Tax=Noviherbaspirillum album TaxID=3080276 RepID=A0ABU6J4G0_9BURK|nr:ArsI/CadI family heavy metal resistance metalloenzyme [Noviherbaspirillum sp. CPCC 100848]MEC4718408.1 ArsI/CadI family heavy metal resistance metalloenzyme [Noviherbaspirillum sp. CPCC 100848]
MKRLHVHVSVDNLDASIQFYTGMFAAEPTVVKTDYAKWMLDDPRVNFAISQRGAQTGLNHLGIQVESASELSEMQCRLGALRPGVTKEEGVACCYAKSDKYWVNDPSGIAWETFHTLDNIPVFGEPNKTSSPDAASTTETEACCVPLAKPRIKLSTEGPCCVPTTPKTTSGACC